MNPLVEGKLDYTQVDHVTILDYETDDKSVEVAYVGGLLFFRFKDNKVETSDIGINWRTLDSVISFLKGDKIDLHARIGPSLVPDEPERLDRLTLLARIEYEREKNRRPTWDEYAIKLARAAAARSEDPYVKVGAVILRENHTVASLGYNGAPAGIQIDWSDRDERRKRVIHAEANALRYVHPGEGTGGLLAATMLPCLECLKMARAQGIQNVIYADDVTANYDASEIFKIADEFGVTIRKV